ncbi:MAG: hypothetical protein IPI52_12225 [Bacteroidetes bacterium]|jgi:hypothetical protein|nr:hypothetical protein [Bacteroidota bacterium]
MKTILLIIGLILYNNLFSQDEKSYCNKIIIEDLFAYENGGGCFMIDDMIFVTQSRIFLLNQRKKVKYKIGAFYCERFTPILTTNCNNLTYFEKQQIINLQVVYNDSIHSLLQKMSSKKIEKNGCQYNIYKLRFSAIYLGESKCYIKKRNKFRLVNIPEYLIYSFELIEPI